MPSSVLGTSHRLSHVQLGCKPGGAVVSIFVDVETEFQEVKELAQGQTAVRS